MPPTRRSARTTSSTTNTSRQVSQPYPSRANASSSTSASPAPPPSSASLSRASYANNGKSSLKLTVKAPPSKLRQATSGSQISPSTIPPNPYAVDTPASESDATPGPAPRVARATRNPRTVVEQDSDEDEDMDAEGEVEEDEEEDTENEVDDELLANEDSDEDAEGEEDDELMDDHPPPPVIRRERPAGKSKPNVTVTAPPEGPLKSVEDKEMEDDDDLSELESGDENEVNADEEDEDELNSDSDEDIDGSRSATPDLSKLTRRQRGAFSEFEGGLMALSNETQIKKHISAEEHAMRRAEMARRRKNLSEKRNEEEKMDTINKLLQKPATKRRTRAEIIAAQIANNNGTPGAEGGEDQPRAGPLFTRWINGQSGSRVAVPDEWLEGPVGEIFGKGGMGGGNGRGRMVEEVA